MLLLCSCSISHRQVSTPELDKTVIEQMNMIYSSTQEKSFCLSSTGIHNIIEGNFLSVPLALCKKTEVVVHTHPFVGEEEAMYFDIKAWEEYNKKYGNWVFGIMSGPGKLKIYVLE